MPHHSTKFDRNQFSGLCVILVTNTQTHNLLGRGINQLNQHRAAAAAAGLKAGVQRLFEAAHPNIETVAPETSGLQGGERNKEVGRTAEDMNPGGSES